MKGRFKHRLQGAAAMLLVVAIVATGVTALAANESKQITAKYSNIKLVIDGVLVTPKDANGNVAEPFIYNGTTYLPVRAVAEALGKSVEWDGATSTVFLGPKVDPPAMAVPIFNRPYIDCTDTGGFKSHEKNGHSYIGFWADGGEQINDLYVNVKSVTYPLDGVASSIQGTILAPSDGDAGRQVVYRFYDESGKLLYTSPIMIGSTQPIAFDVKTTNALSLKIELTYKTTGDRYSNGSGADCLIQDMTITTTDY